MQWIGCLLVVLSLIVGFSPSSVAAACDDLEAAKRATYGFRPSRLTQDAREAKIPILDAFWARVKARGSGGATCLRAMITADSSDGYFALNAASLLASLDQSPTSLAVVELGLARTDLDEVDVAQYVRLVLGLIHAGRDIEKLAEKYLRHPKVDTRIARHGGMLLDRDGGGIIMYGSLSSAVGDRYLSAALALPEPYARATAAKLLAVSLSEPALKALSAFPWRSLTKPDQDLIEHFISRRSSPVTTSATKSRRDVLAAVARIPNYGPDFDGFASDKGLVASAVRILEARDLEALRDARRRAITGVSDEALGEYFAITAIIGGVINRLDLYRDLRLP